MPIAIIDLETSGLHPRCDAICEIGAIFSQHQKIVAEFSSLVNPQRRISNEVIAIHHITNEMLSNAPLLSHIMPDFLKFVGPAVIAGHNVGFDLSFLSPATREFGVDLNLHPLLDTAQIARKLFPSAPSYSLEQLARYLSLPPARFHRALDDARTTTHLLHLIIKELQKHRIYNIAQLIQRFRFPTPLIVNAQLSPLEETLKLALEHTLTVEISYRDSKGNLLQRQITPERITPPYLYAYCHLRQEQRCFRIDRIAEHKFAS
jgi:DNA polymerase III epsilon subunit family exonuclease